MIQPTATKMLHEAEDLLGVPPYGLITFRFSK
jgi:hypothetical protein